MKMEAEKPPAPAKPVRMDMSPGLRILILDRYVFRELIVSFVAVMAFCALLLVVASIFEKFTPMMVNNTPIDKAVLYFACTLPFKLMQVVPIAAMLAVLFSVGNLARNNEILAFMTSGVHTLRIAAPVAVGGVLIFAGSFVMNEMVVPPLEQAGKYLELRWIEGKSETKILTEKDKLVRGLGNRFYMMRLYATDDKRMYMPRIVDMTADFAGVARRIEGKDATLVSSGDDGKGSRWLFTDPVIWTFDDNGEVKSQEKHSGSVTVVLEDHLERMLAQRKKPEEMDFGELREHVQMLAERQQASHEYQTDLYLKILFPLGILIIMIIGFSYAVRIRAGTLMSSFGYGVLWAFLYYGAHATFGALGHAGTFAPIVAALLPNLVFTYVAFYLLKRSYRWYS